MQLTIPGFVGVALVALTLVLTSVVNLYASICPTCTGPATFEELVYLQTSTSLIASEPGHSNAVVNAAQGKSNQ